MNAVASVLVLAGAALAVLAGVGLLRFSTPYARFHAAGKASPVAFLVTATGAAFEFGLSGAGTLAVASAAMVLTLPVGIHLLFRAVHRTSPGEHLLVDDLIAAEHRDRGSSDGG